MEELPVFGMTSPTDPSSLGLKDDSYTVSGRPLVESSAKICVLDGECVNQIKVDISTH